jgi:hypothetical protein
MVRQLRSGRGRNGLILANGGVVTYQHVLCLSSRPRDDKSPYPEENVLSQEVDDIPCPAIEFYPNGAAIIEVSKLSPVLLNIPRRDTSFSRHC